MRKSKSNAGFTLVELSIVLVIIGLIIGGVLSGRQIMQNAQITNAVNAIQGYQAQFQTYVQNYNAMPGDDAQAQTRFAAAGVPAATTTSDGTLAGSFDSAAENAESRLAWADLRAAGLVKGAGSDTTQPANPFGGLYGFQHGAFDGTPLTSNVVCLNKVPGDAAQSIDSRLDDGVGNTGAVMSMVSTDTVGEALAAGATVANYTTANSYTMCVRM